VKLLKEVGPQQWKHDENVALMGAAFRFQASINPYDYVSSLVDGMTDRPDVPPKLTLSANKIPVEFDAAAIAGYLDEFVPDRMIVVAASKAYEAECTLQEKWCVSPAFRGACPADLLLLPRRWRLLLPPLSQRTHCARLLDSPPSLLPPPYSPGTAPSTPTSPSPPPRWRPGPTPRPTPR